MLRQTPADSTGLLGAKVERRVLLLFVVQPELLPLLGVENRQCAGDRLANIVATRNITSIPIQVPLRGQRTSW